MLQVTPKTSALEWFFRRPPTASFPQLTSSLELRQLSKAVDRLSVEFAEAGLAEPSDIKYGYFLAKLAVKLDCLEKIEKADIASLLPELALMLSVVRKVNKLSVTYCFHAVLMALILVAKKSQDVEFRRAVIDLADRVRSAQSASDAPVSV